MLVVCEATREVENKNLQYPSEAILHIDNQTDRVIDIDNKILIEPGQIVLVAILVFLVIMAFTLAAKFWLKRRTKMRHHLTKKAPIWETPPALVQSTINSTKQDLIRDSNSSSIHNPVIEITDSNR